jgi:hypothetical protein
VKRSFGFVPAPSSAARENRPLDLSTSEGLIEHSRRHGEMATLAAVVERGIRANAPKQEVMVVDTGKERIVARVADVEKARNRPLTRAQQAAKDAREHFLWETSAARRAAERAEQEAEAKSQTRPDVLDLPDDTEQEGGGNHADEDQ